MKKCIPVLSGTLLALLAFAGADRSHATAIGSAVAHHGTPVPPLSPLRASEARLRSPRGAGTVLYDQTDMLNQAGLFAINNSAATGLTFFNTDSADDFVVGGDGWTVTGFNVLASTSTQVLLSAPADVTIYADADGIPGDTAVCSSPASSNSASLYDDSGAFAITSAALTLDAPCELAPGTYWVALAFDDPPGGLALWVARAPATGFAAATRNPSGAIYNGACTTWSTVGACGLTADQDAAFQVLGTAHVPVGDITLALTLAKDDGDPQQCGTATALSVDFGDRVNLCYTVTNTTTVDLSYQTLSDTLAGTLFALDHQDLPAGASIQFNRIVTATHLNAGTTTATWTAQDAIPGYHADTTGPSRFVDISASGTRVNVSGDDAAGVNMPFSFPFYDTTTNQITIGENGGVALGPVSGSSHAVIPFLSSALPAGNLHAPTLLPLWDDFDSRPTSGGVYYATIGTAPNRQFVVEWLNVLRSNAFLSSDAATFELILDEADGTFSFEYADVDYDTDEGTSCDAGICATVGIQRDKSAYSQFSYQGAALSDGLSIVWHVNTIAHTSTATATATLDVGAPQAAVAPATLTAAARVGTTTTASLAIGNTGNRDLVWTVDEGRHADSTAHFLRNAPPARATRADGMPTARARFTPAPRDASTRGSLPPFATVLGAASVPAFAYEAQSGQYVSLDVRQPSALHAIAPVPATPVAYLGGTFVGNDFSKEYVLGADPDNGASLSTIDTVSGEITVVQPTLSTSVGDVPVGLRWDFSTDTVYVTGVDVTPAATQSYLYTLDLSTGALNLVGTVGSRFIVSLAVDNEGNLYGLDIIADEIVTIDKTTGAAQTLLAIGFDANYAQSIDFDPVTNTLFYASYDQDRNGVVYAIDVANASIGAVGPIGDGSAELAGLAIAAPTGPCAAPQDVPWLTVSPSSGTTAAGATDAVTVTFDATSLANGTYDASVCVHTNDRTHQLVSVPVELVVSGGIDDRIFADGFDDPVSP